MGNVASDSVESHRRADATPGETPRYVELFPTLRRESLRPIVEPVRCSNELSRGVHGEPDARTWFSRSPSKLSENLIGVNRIKLARAIGSHATFGFSEPQGV